MFDSLRVSSDQKNEKKDEEPLTVTFEEILKDLGSFGAFQARTLVFYLLLEIAVAFVSFIPVCVSITPSSMFEDCSSSSYYQTILSETNMTLDSPQSDTKSIVEEIRIVFDDPFKYESLVDEWDLKCTRSWIPYMFTSCMMAGTFVGNLFWSAIADWYGRRPAYLLVVMNMFLGTLFSAISPNPYFYAVSRFIAGSAFAGFVNVSTMAVLEFMTPKWRSLANMVGPVGEGIILLSVLGHFIRPWRKLYLATLVPYIIIIPLYFLLPESPRWLLRSHKIKEAHELLACMAKVNGKPPVSIETLKTLAQQELKSSEQQKTKKISYLKFLKTAELAKPAALLFAVWFSWNLGYYGISYNIRNVPGSPYLNLGLVGLANAVGQRLSMPASEQFGRRKAVLFGMSLSATFLVTLAVCFLTTNEVSSIFILITSVIGLLGLSCARASLRLLSGESFPTAVRTMGLGLGVMGATSAGLLTPQTAYLGSLSPALPFFIFAAFAVLGSLLVFMMKETAGNLLVDEISTKSEHQKLQC